MPFTIRRNSPCALYTPIWGSSIGFSEVEQSQFFLSNILHFSKTSELKVCPRGNVFPLTSIGLESFEIFITDRLIESTLNSKYPALELMSLQPIGHI